MFDLKDNSTVKQWAGLGLVFSSIGTVIAAMNHDTKWLILGIVSFSLNLRNLIAEDKTGE